MKETCTKKLTHGKLFLDGRKLQDGSGFPISVNKMVQQRNRNQDLWQKDSPRHIKQTIKKHLFQQKKMSSIRVLISCAANLEYNFYQLDVANVFLRGI